MTRTVVYQGRLRTYKGLAQQFNITVDRLRQRLRRGWTLEEALTGKRYTR